MAIPKEKSALQMRLAPAVPVTLEMVDDNGSTFTRGLRIAFDFNSFCWIKKLTGLGDSDFWMKLDDPEVFRAVFWASLLAHQAAFDTRDAEGKPTEEGLNAIGSWIDESLKDTVTDALIKAYEIQLPKKKREAFVELVAQARENYEALQRGEEIPIQPATTEKATTPAPTATPINGLISGPELVTTSESQPMNSVG